MNWKAAAIFVFGQRNVKKTLAAALPLVVLTTTAETIRFDDVDRGPADILQIGPITVKSGFAADPFHLAPHQVATIAGKGLGGALVGSDGSVDRLATFSHDLRSDQETRESISFSSSGGRISSITLMPTFQSSISVPNPPYAAFVFSESFSPLPQGDLVFFYAIMNPGDSKTIGLPAGSFFPPAGTVASTVTLYLDDPDGNLFGLATYEASHGNPDATFDLGFSVVSLEFEPYQPVPDGGKTLFLFGIPVSVLMLARRSGSIHRSRA